MPKFNFRRSPNLPKILPLDTNRKEKEELLEEPLAISCKTCGKTLFLDEVESANQVCVHCGQHFRLSALQRVALLCDENSFTSLEGLPVSEDKLQFPGYAKKLESLHRHKVPELLVGTANMGGVPCSFFAMNSDFLMGSMGSAVGEGLTRLFEHALLNNLPVVGCCLSGGARMQEGTLSLMQMAKVSAAVKRHSEAGLLYISVLCDPTTGGVSASFAFQGDVLLSEPGALIAFAGPRVIEQTIRQKLPKNFQRAEFLLEHGFLDAVVPRAKLKKRIVQLLRLYTANHQPKEAPHFDGEFVLAKKSEETKQKTDAYWLLQAARDAHRPSGRAMIRLLCSEFAELRGDRRYGDDHAIIGGIGRILNMPMIVLAQEKGQDLAERTKRNFGMPHPEGYRKALRLMKQAEKFGLPILCLVDTPGAFCGLEAEARGQAQAVAENIYEMSGLRVPVLSVLLGEGGSGGALALAVADRVWMMQNSVYSVISPEGCASILYKDAKKAEEAAKALKLTPDDLLQLGVIEHIISEEPKLDVEQLQHDVVCQLNELLDLSQADLLEQRYARFRKMGL